MIGSLNTFQLDNIVFSHLLQITLKVTNRGLYPLNKKTSKNNSLKPGMVVPA